MKGKNFDYTCSFKPPIRIKILPLSWALNINDWFANCLLAINAQYLKKTRKLRNKKPVKALHLAARFVTGT